MCSKKTLKIETNTLVVIYQWKTIVEIVKDNTKNYVFVQSEFKSDANDDCLYYGEDDTDFQLMLDDEIVIKGKRQSQKKKNCHNEEDKNSLYNEIVNYFRSEMNVMRLIFKRLWDLAAKTMLHL